MEPILVTFPGGKRVDAQVGPYVIHTDQPVTTGGEGSAAAPFDVFLASVAACSGLYVLAFCQARGLPTDGIRLLQHVDVDPTTHLPTCIRLELALPAAFPEKYRAAVVRAAESCKVKKAIAAAPRFEVTLADGDVALAHAS